ncbi:MAG: Rid family hydrolase [Longimicrobiales bacterium]|nr:Rid family hydrolase [Longimicrobiales bacterium]
MKTVATPHAPAPAGHYSQAVIHNGTVYVAGLLPWDPADPEAPLGDAADQARRVLRSLEAVLTAAGSRLDLLLQVTVYVSRLEDWGAVNAVFVEVLGAHRPARAVVPVLPLKRGAALELVATAAVADPPPA